MNRKVHIVAHGEKITTAAMNPVMAEKVAGVIRQLDASSSQALSLKAKERMLKQNKAESWM